MNDLPEYEQPPVTEVVCGVLFKSLRRLLAPHLGLLWERFREEYPSCKHMAPLAPVVEGYGNAPAVQMELSDIPLMPRTWFVHRLDNGIIQVQQDRFLHNWRRVRAEDEYPRYDAVIKMFRDRLETFASFLADQDLGTITPVQYEMTYVNEIPQGQGWCSRGEVGAVFPDLSWRAEGDRFLSEPEAVNCRFSFRLPDEEGRLHAAIRTSSRTDTGQEVLLLELTARGFLDVGRTDAMWDWFDLAHEWIVRAFCDLTGEDIQKRVWGRRR